MGGKPKKQSTKGRKSEGTQREPKCIRDARFFGGPTCTASPNVSSNRVQLVFLRAIVKTRVPRKRSRAKLSDLRRMGLGNSGLAAPKRFAATA